MPFLDWVNKNQAVSSAANVPYHLLQLEKTYGDAQAAQKNLIIQGDNLQALKALLPFYTGKVKCIYIDPPFNTEQAFEFYDDKLEHSQWLSMIYPRLVLLRELLSEDGSAFVHIDDNELGYLILLLDEVFGRGNRIGIATFKQSSVSGPKTINPGLVTTSSYVLYYAKNKKIWSPNRVFVKTDRDDRYTKFIENIDANYSQWKLCNLKDAFLKHHALGTWKEAKIKFLDSLEDKLTNFVVLNSNRVVRTARVAPKDVNESARLALEESQKDNSRIYKSERDDKDDYYFFNGEQLIFYKSKTRVIDNRTTTASPLTNIWDDLLSNNLHNEGAVTFPKGKKPEGLIKRCLELATSEDDLVLDSFLGSGTTAAVAQKMGRRYIGVEMGDHAQTHCIPRLQKVLEGEQGGISSSVNWQGGGGFSFYTLGEAVFDANGHISPNVRFKALAAYIWLLETKTAIATQESEQSTPFIGEHEGVAYYLLYNGILGDRRPNGGNVLTNPVLTYLESVHPHVGKKVIFGEASRISAGKLALLNISFKQIPYELHERI